MRKNNCSTLLMLVLGLIVIAGFGCSSSNNDAVATETRQAEYEFWTDIARNAVEQSVELLNQGSSRSNGKLDMIIMTNAGYAMLEKHSTEACLDGLREHAGVSEGKKTLLDVHSAGASPLWFFLMDQDNGNGVYCEVSSAALNLSNFSIQGELFAAKTLRNVKADNLFADLQTAHESIFDAAAFNGNEFRIVGIANLLLENAPYDLIRAVQYHDHYCPGVTSGYFLVKYLENNFPLTDEYGSYFVLSIPPWCKDDALMTLLNTTPGKKGYGVFYLNSDDTAALKEEGHNVAGAFFRWNGSGGSPTGEGTVLSFDFAEAKHACNWGAETPWNWWESRIKMDMWYLDYLNEPERFIEAIPVNGKEIFSFDDLPGISQPTDLARPGVNPLDVLGLLKISNTEYDFWKSVGKRAANEALSRMSAQDVSPAAGDLIVLSNAGYAEISGRSSEACIDGLASVSGVSRGSNTLAEIQSHPDKPLWFAFYDKTSGLCVYLQINPAFADSELPPASIIAASDLFAITAVEQVNADHLYANAETYAAKFSNSVFGGNEFRVVTIANAIAAGAPTYAIRSFEFHDHYCPGVTSGILMAEYIKKNFPMQTASDSYFIQTVSPWCKEDALMVMLNATPGKGGYAVSYPTDEDKATWLPEAQNAATIVYRKNGDTGLWDGLVLGYEGGETGCPDYGSSVITKLCSDLWYLERLDQPETFVTVIREFQLPEGADPKAYARPGVDPMKELELVSSK